MSSFFGGVRAGGPGDAADSGDRLDVGVAPFLHVPVRVAALRVAADQRAKQALPAWVP
jgi:hypothetical protein